MNEALSKSPDLPVSAASTAWMLRPLHERAFMRWRVRFEFTIVRAGRLCHEETPTVEALSMHGHDVKAIALRTLQDHIPAGAQLENWFAALVGPRDLTLNGPCEVDGRADVAAKGELGV